MKKIIDISHHHPVKSWDKLVKQSEFLITKATEGTKYVDPTLKSFIKECEKRHVYYWLYTFLKDGNEVAQTKFMVNTCKPLVGKYFMGYILDIESHNKETNCVEALKYLKKESKKTMIYTMYGEYDKYKNLIKNRGTSCAWWEARYGKNNGFDTSKDYPCHSGVDLHQYTSEGKIDGLEGSIDLSKLNGNKKMDFFKEVTKKTYAGSFPTLPSRKYFMIGDKGDEVKKLQKFLIWAGFSVGESGVDGIYGKDTSNAVLKYKKSVGLDPNDGNFGVKCLEKSKTLKR